MFTPFLFIIGFLNKVHQVMQYHLMGFLIIVIWQWKNSLSDTAFVPDPSLRKISIRREYLTKTENRNTWVCFRVSWMHCNTCRTVTYAFLILDICPRQCSVRYHPSYGFYKFSYLFFKCSSDLHLILPLSFRLLLSALQVCQSNTHTHAQNHVWEQTKLCKTNWLFV